MWFFILNNIFYNDITIFKEKIWKNTDNFTLDMSNGLKKLNVYHVL
jgi:hypothetical protein